MPYYVLCGKPDCPGFAHALHVAQYLNEHLPSFAYKKIEKDSEEWAPYICDLNKKNNWHITESPLIWKEITMWGGKKYLIGGLSEFWEYVYCYYGLESLIPKKDVMKLAEDNLKFFEEKRATENLKMAQQETNQLNISIMGVCTQTPILVHELLEMRKLRNKKQIYIKLFDALGERDNSRTLIIAACQFDIDYGTDERFTVVQSIESALDDCDVLIYMYDLSRKIGESDYEWLSRVLFRIQVLTENLNDCVSRNLKVIFNCNGPSCFMASVVLEYCPKLRPSNIVVVTSDEGLSMINIISEETGLSVNQLGAPPVWGFIGINSFVDEKNIVFKATVYRPYKRAITAPQGATLPLGTMVFEFRLLSYLVDCVDHDALMKKIQQRREMASEYLGYPMGLRKVRALTNLLQEWYAEVYSDNIISLGIYSDGSFGLPTGMVFSQPVKLDEKGRWVPYSRFPLMNDNTREKISNCAKEAKEICEKFIIPSTNEEVEYEETTWDVRGEWSPMETYASIQSLETL